VPTKKGSARHPSFWCSYFQTIRITVILFPFQAKKPPTWLLVYFSRLFDELSRCRNNGTRFVVSLATVA
jgi:hypothetical protein